MKQIAYEQLKPGMTTAEDIYAMNGQQLLVPKGTKLTPLKLQLMGVFSIRTVYIEDDIPQGAGTSESVDKKATVNDLRGSGIPGFISNLPEPVREARIQEIKEYKKTYGEGLNYFQVAVNNLVAKNTDLNVDTILSQTLSLLHPKKQNISVLEMLLYMKEYDNSVYSHCINTSLLCKMLAQWLEYSEEDCRMAAACGLFHDMGQLAIPDEIIQKPGPLTPEERAIINTHPEKGYQMLEEYGVNETVRLSALMHHEKCDGSGYPRGLKDDEIDRFAKLVTICDIYDAMTSDRPYRKALTPFAVIEHFETDGLSKFDTRAILLFQENTANTYLNCPVRLSNGAVGYVVFINRGRLGRPIVQCGKEFYDLSKRDDLSIAEMLAVV